MLWNAPSRLSHTSHARRSMVTLGWSQLYAWRKHYNKYRDEKPLFGGCQQQQQQWSVNVQHRWVLEHHSQFFPYEHQSHTRQPPKILLLHRRVWCGDLQRLEDTLLRPSEYNADLFGSSARRTAPPRSILVCEHEPINQSIINLLIEWHRNSVDQICWPFWLLWRCCFLTDEKLFDSFAHALMIVVRQTHTALIAAVYQSFFGKLTTQWFVLSSERCRFKLRPYKWWTWLLVRLYFANTHVISATFMLKTFLQFKKVVAKQV